MNMNTKQICVTGLLTALVWLATSFLRVPIVATSGYIHLGDSVILLSALLLTKRYAVPAAAIGSFLADLLAGYPQWSLFTLLIKAAMCLLVCYTAAKGGSFVGLRNIAAVSLGAITMVVGYFFAGALLLGSFAVAAVEIVPNLIQGFGGAVIAITLSYALKNARHILLRFTDNR